MKQQDYREDLRSEFLRRTRVRPQYSLRAFARDLELSPSRLCDLLNLKTHLSLRTARKITSYLNLSTAETENWLAQVEMMSSRSPQKRKAAMEALKSLKLKAQPRRLSSQEFRILSNWYMLAIVELAATGQLDTRDAYWARVLGISDSAYRQALIQLVQHQFIKQDKDSYSTVDRSHMAGDQGPSQDVREFHTQLLDQAKDRLLRAPAATRDFNARYISITPAQYENLKEKIRHLLDEAMIEGGRETQNSQVYALTVQLFPLTQNIKGEKNAKT